jgi:hypothetical protein
MSTGAPPVHERPFQAFDKKTLAQNIQELMDREELHDLVYRYAICAGQGEGHMMADLFTEDGSVVAHFPDGQRPQLNLQGRNAIADGYSVMRWGITIPTIHNCMLDVTGDTAAGICSIEVRRLEDGQSFIGSGYYEDKFRRQNGRWKFVTREAFNFHWVPLQKGWAGSPLHKPSR